MAVTIPYQIYGVAQLFKWLIKPFFSREYKHVYYTHYTFGYETYFKHFYFYIFKLN